MADKPDPRPTSRRRGGAPAGGDAAKPEQPGKTPAATDPEQPKTPTSKDLTEVGASSPASVVPAPQSRAAQGLFGVSGPGDTSGFSGLTRPAGGGVPVTSSPRPYGGYLDDVADALQVAYPHFDKAVISVLVDRGEITFYVRREHLLGMCKTLRDNASLRFELCSSISGVDYLEPDADTSANPHARERLHSVYHLTSMTFRRRIRLEVAVPVEDPHIPSVYSVYPTADWQERETWDMYGIIYDGHPALTRILMPDDWDGFPQRKDYPLGGIPVEYKGASIPPPDERRVYR